MLVSSLLIDDAELAPQGPAADDYGIPCDLGQGVRPWLMSSGGRYLTDSIMKMDSGRLVYSADWRVFGL